ncbi:MAG: CoA-binding protein [Acidobacteriales bacterium]|nr:CoA-binding protein [Terriglobales bacterium]
MATLQELVEDFLALKRIAVVGVSRADKLSPANAIWKKLLGAGYEAFAVNPQTDEIDGQPCHRSLGAIPSGVDAVVFAAPPGAAEEVVRECAQLGIHRFWMHRALGTGSFSPAAAELARQNGIAVIAGACPMMYVPPVDIAHKCFKFVLRITGGLPNPQ